MSPRSRLQLALAATALLLAGCGVHSITDVEEALGFVSKSKTTIFTLQSIELRSNHPTVATAPAGPASISATSGTITFTAIGTFSIDNNVAVTATNDVSSGVVWTSSNPALALPGSDGLVVAHGSAGVATITATTPALGSIPALSSNSIPLTIQ